MGQADRRNEGMCFAFPDVCLTPAPPSPPVPIPYPNIAQLADATGTAPTSTPAASAVMTRGQRDRQLHGRRGRHRAAASPAARTNGKCTFTSFSATVKANGKGIVRQLDHDQPEQRQRAGQVLGGLPTVLVGD